MIHHQNFTRVIKSMAPPGMSLREALAEWDCLRIYEEDTQCVCEKEIYYCYVLKRARDGAILDPVGSICVKRVGLVESGLPVDATREEVEKALRITLENGEKRPRTRLELQMELVDRVRCEPCRQVLQNLNAYKKHVKTVAHSDIVSGKKRMCFVAGCDSTVPAHLPETSFLCKWCFAANKNEMKLDAMRNAYFSTTYEEGETPNRCKGNGCVNLLHKKTSTWKPLCSVCYNKREDGGGRGGRSGGSGGEFSWDFFQNR